MGKANLSEVEISAASNLRAIWKLKKKTLGLTQAKVAKACLWESHSSFSLYLSGYKALNYETVVKLSNVLMVHPTDISESLVKQVGGTNCFLKIAPNDLIDMYHDELSKSGGNEVDLINYVCRDSGLTKLQVKSLINNHSKAEMYGANELFVALSKIEQLRHIYGVDPINPDSRDSLYWSDRCNNLSIKQQVKLKDFITILEKWG